MYGNNATLYPMLAVGAFMSAFWTGIVLGNEMGLGCVSLLILGLLSAFTASVGVCELQRRAERGCACPRAPMARLIYPYFSLRTLIWREKSAGIHS